MKILVTGATGFVGFALSRELLKASHELYALSRNPNKAREKLGPRIQVIQGDLENALPDLTRIGQLDAVIHLAGENVGSGRWTPSLKQHILRSRELGTQNLMDAISRLKVPPRVVISASAVGYYGSRGDELLAEDSKSGDGFLSLVCQKWERPLESLSSETRRVVFRIGVVLGRGGGMLEKVIPPFKAGVGGKLGSGRQWMSWIHLTDLVQLFSLALTDSRFEGVINAVAPEPVQNKNFTHELGTLLHRPTLLSVPAFALRTLFGEMADQTLLASQRVDPARLRSLRFPYAFPSLESALKEALGS